MGIAIDTATIRADFVERSLNPLHIAILDGMVKTSNEKDDRLFPPRWNGQDVAEDMRRVAGRAELFTASNEMFDLIMHAAESLPPQKIDFTDLPTDEGWLHLPDALMLEDVRGLMIPVRDIMWSRRMIGHEDQEAAPGVYTGEGVVVWSFVELGDYRDALTIANPEAVQRIKEHAPNASLMHVQTVGFDSFSWSVVDESGDGTRDLADAMMRSMHDVDTTYEDLGDGTYRAMNGTKTASVRLKPDPLVQLLMSYWHFAKSELTDLTEDHLTRQIRRSFKRRDLPTGPVTVVQLRRAKAEHGDGEWTLTYRHIRRGHWRKQWYGSAGSRYQKHIWISPTVVGPEDGPLVERDVVNVVIR